MSQFFFDEGFIEIKRIVKPMVIHILFIGRRRTYTDRPRVGLLKNDWYESHLLKQPHRLPDHALKSDVITDTYRLLF